GQLGHARALDHGPHAEPDGGQLQQRGQQSDGGQGGQDRGQLVPGDGVLPEAVNGEPRGHDALGAEGGAGAEVEDEEYQRRQGDQEAEGDHVAHDGGSAAQVPEERPVENEADDRGDDHDGHGEGGEDG